MMQVEHPKGLSREGAPSQGSHKQGGEADSHGVKQNMGGRDIEERGPAAAFLRCLSRQLWEEGGLGPVRMPHASMSTRCMN